MQRPSSGWTVPEPADVPSSAVLEFAEVTKRFGTEIALAGVSMRVEAGTVHALVGENGAGKSTMMRIASGAMRADSGRVLVCGKLVEPSPRSARACGIRIVYQERQIAAPLTVAENVLLGQLPSGPLGRVRRKQVEEEARRRLSLLGLELDLHRPAGELTVAEMQLVELARAMSEDAKLLLLDEPTASLHAHEVERLMVVVRRLAARGMAVVWISHHLQEAFELAKRATVLRDGRVVGTVEMDEVTPSELLSMMFGESVDLRRQRADSSAPRRDVALVAEHVSVERMLHDVSLELRRGEVLALAGGVGSGTHILARVLAGAMRPDAGEVRLGPDRRAVRSRRDAASRGIGFLPGDRRHDGLLPDRSVLENLMLAQVAIGKGLVVTKRRQRARATELVRSANVKMAADSVAIETLSGGNQQKVMLGRWLGVGSSVLIFDEPTVGIDLASRFELYQQITQLADEGVAIAVVSEDYEEIALIGDRVLVMRRGRIVAELGASEAEPDHVRELTLAGA